MILVAPPPRAALVPNAIAFRDPQHGIMGTGWQSCASGGFGRRPQGTVAITSDGGRTWNVLFRTPRPVVSVSYAADRSVQARFDDGETLAARRDRGRWAPTPTGVGGFVACPQGTSQQTSNSVAGDWALCTTQGSAGSMGKSVWRLGAHGWRRVAQTPFAPPAGKTFGGIGLYGYPLGIAGARDGFGIIWESRGTLYVTRDGGSHWTGLPAVAAPEVDFGDSAYALPHGIGFVLLAHGGTEARRLLETTDFGRSWRVVHTWK